MVLLRYRQANFNRDLRAHRIHHCKRSIGFTKMKGASMNKLVAIVTTTLCALLCCTSNAHAQGTLPRIGVVKWSIHLNDLRDCGQVAHAIRADLLFIGTYHGTIVVVDLKRGAILDTIDLLLYPMLKGIAPNNSAIYNLQATDDGTLIAVSLAPHRSLLMIDYPSKNLLDSVAMGLGMYAGSPQFVFLSPKGRYLVNNGALVDRTSGYVRQIHSAQMRVSFDSAETVVAYNVPGTVSGKLCSDFINTWTLSDTTTEPESYDVVGYPTLSVDGTKLLSSGRTVSADGKWASRPMAVIMNIADKTRLWQVSGDFSPDPGDFCKFAWSPDGSKYYGIRRSTALPTEQKSRLFGYTMASSQPLHYLSDGYISGNAFQPLINSSMTEAYVVAYDDIYAIDLTKVATSIGSPGVTNSSDTVYPNPNDGRVTISCSNLTPTVSWKVTAPNGALAAEGNNTVSLNSTDNRVQYSIEIGSSLPAGVYVLSIYSQSHELLCTAPLVKQ